MNILNNFKTSYNKVNSKFRAGETKGRRNVIFLFFAPRPTLAETFIKHFFTILLLFFQLSGISQSSYDSTKTTISEDSLKLLAKESKDVGKILGYNKYVLLNLHRIDSLKSGDSV